MKLNLLLRGYTFARVTRLNTQPATQPPTSTMPVISQLKDRCLLSIEGEDAKKVLHGLITNDIEQINEKRMALYTGFLNIKGRLVSDAFIMTPRIFTQGKLKPKDNEYWLDVHKDLKKKLEEHITKYSWKKKIIISDIKDDVKLCVMYNDPQFSKISFEQRGCLIEPPQGLTGSEGDYGSTSFIDPRLPSLGVRMIINGDEYEESGLQVLPADQFNTYQQLHAVTSSTQMTDKIPFQYNVDLLGGISFTKGCYLGQQLMARSFHTGIVRRRVFPFICLEDGEMVEINKPLMREDKEIGKVIKYDPVKKNGLVLLNYLDIEPFEELRIDSPCKVVLLNPLHDQINKYLDDVRLRQKSQEKLEE